MTPIPHDNPPNIPRAIRNQDADTVRADLVAARAEIKSLWDKLISARLGDVLNGLEVERLRSFLERIEYAAGRDAQTGRGAELACALASGALKRWREETERAAALKEEGT